MGKEDAEAHRDHKDIADHIQERISRDRLKVRKHRFENTDDERHQDRAVDRFDTEFRPDQQKAYDQQEYIHDQGDQGNRQRDEIAEHHGQGRSAAHADMTGHHKEEHGSSYDHRSKSDRCEFFDIPFREHQISSFLYIGSQTS